MVEDVCQVGNGRVVTRWLDDETIEATYSGYLSEILIEEGRKRFWFVAGARAPRFALVDVGAMTGFSKDVVNPGRRFLAELKERGGAQVVVVTTRSAFKMLASALMFAMGAPIYFVSTREAALTRLETTRQRQSRPR